MLLCRRIIRAHTSNPLSTRKLVQAHVRDSTFLNLRTSQASLATRENDPKVPVHTTTLRLEQQPSDPRAALLERVLRVSRYSVPKTSKHFKLVHKAVVSEKCKHDPFDAYAELRAQYPSLLASVPTDALCRLAEGAVKHGSQNVVDSLTADVLDDTLLYPEQRAQVAAYLLSIPPRHPILLDKQTILSLLTHIHHQGQLSDLPAAAALHVMKSVTERTPSPQVDESLMNLVLSPFLNHLASLPSPTRAEAVSYKPPDAIWIAYGLIDKLVAGKRLQEAFDLLQTLASRGHVPPEAFQSEVPPPLAHDFAVIVRSTLARSCLHWHWHHRGVGFIASIIQSQDSLKQDLEPLTLELLHSSLESCSPEQFKACAWLMCQLVDPRHGIVIPPQTIQLYYSRALRVGDRESARLFYSHAQSPRAKALVNYQPPQGAPLLWLMSYIASQKHDVHLARRLAKQVVDNSVPIPLYDRSRFIALAANHGFAKEARALWELYSTGLHHKLVVGNAATMLRMVSLFTQRDSWARERLERMPGQTHGLADTPEDGLRKHTEYSQFAYQVLLAFQESIMPLEEANHFDLSALARGWFMLGETTEGLRPFRVLIGRREIPDRLDINIALSAMARHSPRAAYQMVERMIEQGIRPGAVTFGTVLHQAIVYGDAELVTEVLERARKVGVKLSSKAMVSLIRSSVAVGEGVDDDLLEANVKRAWDVVRTAPESSVVHSPNVGKCCIVACLHLEDPVMAFNFWALLIRGKTEWEDEEQAKQRRQISRLVRRHCVEGRLELEQARVMLRGLGDRRDV